MWSGQQTQQHAQAGQQPGSLQAGAPPPYMQHSGSNATPTFNASLGPNSSSTSNVFAGTPHSTQPQSQSFGQSPQGQQQPAFFFAGQQGQQGQQQQQGQHGQQQQPPQYQQFQQQQQQAPPLYNPQQQQSQQQQQRPQWIQPGQPQTPPNAQILQFGASPQQDQHQGRSSAGPQQAGSSLGSLPQGQQLQHIPGPNGGYYVLAGAQQQQQQQQPQQQQQYYQQQQSQPQQQQQFYQQQQPQQQQQQQAPPQVVMLPNGQYAIVASPSASQSSTTPLYQPQQHQQPQYVQMGQQQQFGSTTQAPSIPLMPTVTVGHPGSMPSPQRVMGTSVTSAGHSMTALGVPMAGSGNASPNASATRYPGGMGGSTSTTSRPLCDTTVWGYAIVDPYHPTLQRVPVPPSVVSQTKGVRSYNNDVSLSSTKPCTSIMCMRHLAAVNALSAPHANIASAGSSLTNPPPLLPPDVTPPQPAGSTTPPSSGMNPPAANGDSPSTTPQSASLTAMPNAALTAGQGCPLGEQCHNFHISPAYVEAARACTDPLCCGLHNCYYTREMMRSRCAPHINDSKFTLVLEDRSEVDVLPAQLAYTIGLDHLSIRGQSRVITMRKQVCRLHLEGRCKWTKDCGHVHLCRELHRALATFHFPSLLFLLSTESDTAKLQAKLAEVGDFVRSRSCMPLTGHLIAAKRANAVACMVAGSALFTKAMADEAAAIGVAVPEALVIPENDFANDVLRPIVEPPKPAADAASAEAGATSATSADATQQPDQAPAAESSPAPPAPDATDSAASPVAAQ